MQSMMVASLAVLALFTAASGARADEQFATRMFGGQIAAKGKSYACFTRRYDKAHLAQHRHQKVTAMKLLVTAEMVPEDKAFNYSFNMGVKFRDRKGSFSTSGSCGHPAASQETDNKLLLGCGVDCDGGGLSVEMVNTDKSVMVRIERMAIWDDAKPDDEDGRTGFDGGADDKAFRLDRVSTDDCKTLMPKNDDLAALEPK